MQVSGRVEPVNDKDLIWCEIRPDDPQPRIKSIEYGKESVEVILDYPEKPVGKGLDEADER